MAEQSKFEFGLNKERHAAGEAVTGTLRAAEDIDARSVTVALRYYQESPDYLEYAQEAGTPVVHQGPLRGGEGVPFSFQLPDDALPSHVSKHGRVGWRLVAQADLPRRFDHTERLPIEVDPAQTSVPASAAVLTATQHLNRVWILLPVIGAVVLAVGIASGGVGGIAIGAVALAAGLFLLVRGMARSRATKSWDVSASAASTAVRRGDDVELAVQIGAPGNGRNLEVGLTCRETYAVKRRDMTDDHDNYRRETDADTAYAEWVPVDASAPEQTISIRVPEDGPFSYGGHAVGYGWALTLREKRRGADASHAAQIQVLP